VKIPVRLHGTPVGVHTDGGVLDHVPPVEGVKFLQDAELPIASVVASRAAVSEADAEPAEPEVLKARKADEE
jgi:hypothetical protein